MPLNSLIAKNLSKVIHGTFGSIVHFFLMGFIYCKIGDMFYWLAVHSIGVNKIFPPADMKKLNTLIAHGKFSEAFQIPIFTIAFTYAVIMFILPWIATFQARKYYKKAQDKKHQEKHQTFGKARFAETDEVTQAGLYGSGIIFGKIGRVLVTKPPKVEGHTLIVGGTGTGKSRGVVIPTLLSWEGSAIVMDIKGELSKFTADRRLQHGSVYVFDPEGDGACYDPIKTCKSVDQAQDLARTLIPAPETGEAFWANSAQALLSAFVFEGAHRGYKLTDIAEWLCTRPIAELVSHCQNHELREVRILASITYEQPDKTLSGIVAELKSKLITIATDPNIRRATQRSDWTAETLESGATVYLKVSEHLLDQYKDLWTIIISQIMKHLSRREERKSPPILMALDEMPRLSKLDGLSGALATLRSRNVHIMPVVQSMAQLDSIYGRDERKVIADNCRFKFVLSATDPETQKYFSDLAGQKTAMSRGISTGGGIMLHQSASEHGTPLIRPEEWAMLKQPILLAPMLHPLKVELAFWDKHSF